MDLGEFYEKHKQYYYWKLSRNISGMGLAFHAEDIIHDVVVNMIADEKQRTKFEGPHGAGGKGVFCVLPAASPDRRSPAGKAPQGISGNAETI